jgi:outer membrane protein
MTRPTAALLALALAASPFAGGAEPAPGAPLTLDDALALAARENHDLAMSRVDAAQAGADLLATTSGVLPRLDLQASVGKVYYGPSSVSTVDPITNQVVTGTTSAASYNSDALSVSLTQPLVDLATWKLVAQGRASERAAARTFDESRLTLAFEVTRRFYEVVKAERSLAVLEKAAARSEELVGRADALFAAGRAPKADIFTARGNLGADRIALSQGRTRLGQARADLATILGQPGDRELAVVPPAPLAVPLGGLVDPPPLPTLLATARTHRPSLAAAEAQLEAARQGVDSARFGYLPTLSAQGSYQRSGSSFGGADGVWGDPTRAYVATAQLLLSWNLFQGRRTEAQLQRAVLGEDRARAGAAKSGDAVAQEIATARQRAVALAGEAVLSAENLGAAEQGLALARQRLEAGLGTQLEVRDATLKLTQAELSLVQARIDHAVAVADLTRAVGGAL